jgi:Asp-tRNA(Asn)/Glu-tRNA(Gln) amidotransferase A subunit family amidase
MIEHYHQDSAEGDIVVFPSVEGTPPKLGHGTGSRDPQRLWTLLGLPALNVPIGWNKNFPFNLQLIGRHGADRELLEAGRVVTNLLEQVTL